MTEDPKKAYNHFAHLNDFLKKEQQGAARIPKKRRRL